MQFQPAKEQISRTEVKSSFSFPLKSRNCQPQNPNFKDFSRNVNSWNDKWQFCLSLQKIYEELSAKQMVKTAQSESFQIRLIMSRKRSVRQRFYSNYTVAFSFFAVAHNDRGYGHLAVCGSIRCRETTRWMREQNRRNASQPANAHRRVLGGRFFLVVFSFVFLSFQSTISHRITLNVFSPVFTK